MTTCLLLPGPVEGHAAGTRFIRIARALFAAGEEVCLVSSQPCMTARRTIIGESPAYLSPIQPGLKARFFTSRVHGRSLIEGLRRCEGDYGVTRVILYGASAFQTRAISAASRGKMRLFCDVTEFYPVSARRMLSPNFWDHRLFSVAMRQCDGVLAISSFWENFALRRGVKALRVPSLCEPTLEEALNVSPNVSGRYRDESLFRLVYIGIMSKRDLPETLISAVQLARKRGCNVELIVVGNVDKSKHGRRIRRIVEADECLNGAVHFTGWVSNEELYFIMSGASALVLVRGNDLFSRACFPTRLPEMLLTGRPVILSESGDFSEYLTHRKDTYFVPSGRKVESLACAIQELASDENLAAMIGAEGRRTAVKAFGIARHGERLLQFLS